LLQLQPATIENTENMENIEDSADSCDTCDSATVAVPAESGNSEKTDTAQSSAGPVLIFPNPSAPLFTQQDATELSHADHLLFGCGV